VCIGDDSVAWDAELAAHVEELVLDFREAGDDRVWERWDGRDGQEDAYRAVELVYRSVGLHAGTVFGDAGAVAQAGGAVVTGSCVDFAQAIAHAASLLKGPVGGTASSQGDYGIQRA